MRITESRFCVCEKVIPLECLLLGKSLVARSPKPYVSELEGGKFSKRAVQWVLGIAILGVIRMSLHDDFSRHQRSCYS